MYKAIIFDFFDVIHSDPFHAWMKKHGFTRQGAIAETSRLLDRGDINMHKFFQKLSEASNVPAAEIESDFHAFSRMDHQMVEFVRKVHASYKTALLSNAEGEYLRNILTEHELNSLFDVIVISSEVRLIKPEPEVFLHMLEKLGTNASDTIFVDDNENNTQVAEKLGIKALHYRDLATLRAELTQIGVSV